MTDKLEIGKKGEEIASAFLEKKGYKILEMNYRVGSYEVDIIAEKDDVIVIVEVKTRKSNSLVEPEASVTKMKQRNLIAAANFYLKVTNSQKEARFDIIGITYLKSDFSVNHIIDAFYPLIRSR